MYLKNHHNARECPTANLPERIISTMAHLGIPPGAFVLTVWPDSGQSGGMHLQQPNHPRDPALPRQYRQLEKPLGTQHALYGRLPL